MRKRLFFYRKITTECVYLTLLKTLNRFHSKTWATPDFNVSQRSGGLNYLPCLSKPLQRLVRLCVCKQKEWI